MPSNHTGINFSNDLTHSNEVNVYTFRNFYNGAGVGIGDFNNDGLADIFFCGNQVDNKLYLNEGDFRFRDITTDAGVASKNVWTTGVSVVDINGDGWLDIYICKSGDPRGQNRHNELFINQGRENNVSELVKFTEESERYGLNDLGLSTHAAFFDYDLDGDLDCYLLNNSVRSVGNYDLRPDQRETRDKQGGNKLYRNNRKGPGDAWSEQSPIFTDVSAEAGIYGSNIGFGLGVTIGDINGDGWPDIYVSNDFFEKDYLYFNQGDGTFDEAVDDFLSELSMGSMGADLADINNDGLPEIFVTEMLPRDERRLKTKALFEDWNKYQANIKNGYHQQFSRNVLQLNQGNGQFLEVGRYAGVEATDWSWGALIFDMDNDGWKDIFVANGIFKDLLDQDFINFYADPAQVRKVLKDRDGGIDKLVDEIPSEALANFAFRNLGNIQYENVATLWGLAQPSFSNGSAYGDLDNDGDLDLVINNINMPPMIYRNRSNAHYFQLALVDTASLNHFGIGAKITVFHQGKSQYQEIFPARGFMSSVDVRATFGLGEDVLVDSVRIVWPDGTTQTMDRMKADTAAVVYKMRERPSKDAKPFTRSSEGPAPIFKDHGDFRPYFQHRENDYSDFDREPLLLQMHSNQGPACCIGDINGDGLTDFYIGGAKGQSGQMFVQHKPGTFAEISVAAFEQHQESEDCDCVFFDANGDNLPDLYVASGSSEYGPNDARLADRLYMNTGDEQFIFSRQILPYYRFENTSAVETLDFDHDGDNDLVVGTFIRPIAYGIPSDVYLLQNDGTGLFVNVSDSLAPDFSELGLVSDLAIFDHDQDGDPDIVAVGEWMGVKIFHNVDGKFVTLEQHGLESLGGFWNTVAAADMDEDGRPDLLLGNHGLNSRITASREQPLRMYVNDFDQNGQPEQIICYSTPLGLIPFALRNDLLKQLPHLGKRFPNFQSYALKGINDIFESDQLDHSLIYSAVELRSGIAWSTDDGSFIFKAFPPAAQYTPLYALLPGDFDNDGLYDILVGGNQYRMKPEIGINDGSLGLLLKGQDNRHFKALSPEQSGISITGEIRDLKLLESDESSQILVARNNRKPKIIIAGK